MGVLLHTGPLKLFEITDGEASEWVAAYTNIQAVYVLCCISGAELCDYEKSTVKEIPEHEWKLHSIDDEFDEFLMTFADAMQQITRPTIIATTKI